MVEVTEEKKFTVYMRGMEYYVKAERFVLEDDALKFLTGSTLVAAFTNWDGVV